MTTTETTDHEGPVFEDRVAQLEEIGRQLAALVPWLQSLRRIQDGAIRTRINRLGEPCTIDGNRATTTHKGYDAVELTLHEENIYEAPFAALREIEGCVEQVDWSGLRWDYEPQVTS